MSEPKKYVYACIRIPIEIKMNGHHITYNDHAKVDFEKCGELPPKSNLGKYDLAEIFENMSKSQLEPTPISTSQPPISTSQPPISTSQPPISTSQPPISTSQPPISTSQPIVLQSEIKTSKPPMKNSSFKNRQSTSSSKYSQKNRPN
jgi:hypothetical protein